MESEGSHNFTEDYGTWMKKILILDSNVLLNDPYAYLNFKDNDVYILDIVRTEVSSKRHSEKGAVGKNAAIFNEEMYKLAQQYPSEILAGIKINIDPNDPNKHGTLRIVKHSNVEPKNLSICLVDKDSRDHLILSEAKKLKENSNQSVIVITDDYKFATDCVLEGIEQQPYKHDKIISDIKDIYKGYIYIPVDAELFDKIEDHLENENNKRKIYLKNSILESRIDVKEIEDDTFLKDEVGSYQKNLISKIKLYNIHIPELTEKTLYPNEFIILQKTYGDSKTEVELVLFINFSDPNKPFLERLRIDEEVCGLKSKSTKADLRNLQQDMFIHLSKVKSIDILAGLGPAGSGKTLLALAAAVEDANLVSGFEQLTKNKKEIKNRKVYVSRTFVTLEKDLGALPGTEEEKTAPLFRPIQDNLNVIMGANSVAAKNAEDNIDFLTFTYLQGRSLNDAIILLDEAQNTHIVDMESFLTRSGENSRIFLTGDPLQVRKLGVGQLNNGLTQVVERFKGCPFFAIVYMQQAVRSNIAEYATILLNRI